MGNREAGICAFGTVQTCSQHARTKDYGGQFEAIEGNLQHIGQAGKAEPLSVDIRRGRVEETQSCNEMNKIQNQKIDFFVFNSPVRSRSLNSSTLSADALSKPKCSIFSSNIRSLFILHSRYALEASRHRVATKSLFFKQVIYSICSFLHSPS